jgi:hypothetical protein
VLELIGIDERLKIVGGSIVGRRQIREHCLLGLARRQFSASVRSRSNPISKVSSRRVPKNNTHRQEQAPQREQGLEEEGVLLRGETGGNRGKAEFLKRAQYFPERRFY